ncbi:MAG: hypothetical protein JXA69_05830 [Phycisphaerae bacterium]|nr:hypothetical protein [Phycisphaerae bacterium]
MDMPALRCGMAPGALRARAFDGHHGVADEGGTAAIESGPDVHRDCRRIQRGFGRELSRTADAGFGGSSATGGEGPGPPIQHRPQLAGDIGGVGEPASSVSEPIYVETDDPEVGSRDATYTFFGTMNGAR